MTLEMFEKYGDTSLDIKQVASICCVSVDRVHLWIKKRGLKAAVHDNSQHIASSDLVDFLVQYNTPIPGVILPAQAKKILFVFSKETLEFIYVKFLTNFFRKLKTDADFICDFVSYGNDAKYKLMTFLPDLLVTDATTTCFEAIKLNEFSKKFFNNKILTIIDNSADDNNIKKIELSDVDAVVTRSMDIKDLVLQINNLFQ